MTLPLSESEIGVSTASGDYDTVTLNIPDDSPLAQNFLADNDDAAMLIILQHLE